MVRSTGFVTVDGGAYAVYYLAYVNDHADQELALIVSVGDWGEGANEAEREAFYCRLRPADGNYELMLADAADSQWGDVALLGRKLSRDEARAHPLRKTLFALADEIGTRDPRVVGYFERAECGDTNIPLEHSFGMPDAVWSLSGEERGDRANIGQNFVKLDGERHFVRALLSFDVEHYGDWSAGLWVEVSAEMFEQVQSVWDHPDRYMALTFAGRLANDLSGLELPGRIGSGVTLHAVDPEQALRVRDSMDPELQKMRVQAWGRSDFENFAVAHGFL